MLTKKQKLILKILQSDFPLTKHPYQTIAERLGISAPVLLSKIRSLRSKGLIRRIGGIISGERIRYKSVLISVKVAKANIRRITSYINSFENVSHNYLRNSEFNIWFTFSAKTKKEINLFIQVLKRQKAIEEVLVLPAEKVFKINTEFELK